MGLNGTSTFYEKYKAAISVTRQKIDYEQNAGHIDVYLCYTRHLQIVLLVIYKGIFKGLNAVSLNYYNFLLNRL